MSKHVLVNTQRSTVSGDGMISFGAGNTIRPMKSLVFEGKCTQDGTPTPDNPIPIKQNDSKWKSTGFNLWDEEWEVGGLSSQGQKNHETDKIRSKNYIPVFPNTDYYISKEVPLQRSFYYDEGKRTISTFGTSTGYFRTPENCHFIMFSTTVAYGTTYNHDICINISQPDTSISPHNGDYEPYHLNGTVDLSSIKLNSIPGTDINDEFDAQTGKLTRRVHEVVMDGVTGGNFGKHIDRIHNTSPKDVFITTALRTNPTHIEGDRRCYCQYFPYSAGYYSNEIGCFMDANHYYGIVLKIPYALFNITKGEKTNAELVDLTNAWLKDLYDNGTPLVYYYPLETPTVEYLTPQPITQAKSVNTIQQTEGSIPSTHVSGEYSKDKNYILCENAKSYILNDYFVKHYTVRWDKEYAQMTRLNDAANITTDITHFAHRGFIDPAYNNPFDSIYPWSGRKLCNISIDAYRSLAHGQSLKDCVTAWEGDTNFSYTDPSGVWVYTPEFWGNSWDDEAYRYFEVADGPCQGYVYYRERIEGRWHGRTQTVNIDGTDKTCLIPSVGMPAKRIAKSTLHTYAKNWGATLDTIFSIDANDLLMIVEFATMNSQNAIGSGVDSMYRQTSDLISAEATESTVVKINKSAGSAFCIPGAIFDIGTSNGGTQIGSFLVVSAVADPDDSTLLDVTLNAPVTVTTSNYWSVHGMSNVADADIGSQSGYIRTNGKCIAYYRGEELFGNMYFYTLGAYRQSGTEHVWIAHNDNEADTADALNTDLHIDTGIALSTTGGYIKKLGILPRSGLLCCPPFCTEKGGNATNPVGDEHTIDTSASNTVLLHGGRASNSTKNGVFHGFWLEAASGSSWFLSARPCLLKK